MFLRNCCSVFPILILLLSSCDPGAELRFRHEESYLGSYELEHECAVIKVSGYRITRTVTLDIAVLSAYDCSLDMAHASIFDAKRRYSATVWKDRQRVNEQVSLPKGLHQFVMRFGDIQEEFSTDNPLSIELGQLNCGSGAINLSRIEAIEASD